MPRGPHATAAFVEKAFGLEGDVVVRRAAGVSFSVLAHVPLHVVPPADPNEAPRVLHVASVDGVDAAELRRAARVEEGGRQAKGGEGARPAGEDLEPRTARVRFVEVDDAGTAKVLAGRRLLAAQEELRGFGVDAGAGGGSDSVAASGAAAGSGGAGSGGAAPVSPNGTCDVLGCEVCDERYGVLGVVRETISTPANDVWVVEGRYGEVLVPVVGECVAGAVPDDARRLFTHVIDGIVDEGGAAS